MIFNEGFEEGALGALVADGPTGFWIVEQDWGPAQNDGEDLRLVYFTDEAYMGELAAYIPVPFMQAKALTYAIREMSIMGGGANSDANKVVNQPFDLTFYYKYRVGHEDRTTQSFFGRNIFEAYFGVFGEEILHDDGYTYVNYQTALTIAIEHKDDTGQWIFQGESLNNAYPTIPTSVLFDSPPQQQWLKIRFFWEGASPPEGEDKPPAFMHITVESADPDPDSGVPVVYFNQSYPTPPGVGIAYCNLYSMAHEAAFPNEGFNFQNWIDGDGVIVVDPPTTEIEASEANFDCRFT